MDKILENWFEFRNREIEILTEEDKKHLYDFEKCTNEVFSCINKNSYKFAEKQFEKLERETLNSTEYFNKKYYIAGFRDALELILSK